MERPRPSFMSRNGGDSHTRRSGMRTAGSAGAARRGQDEAARIHYDDNAHTHLRILPQEPRFYGGTHHRF